MVFDWNLVVAMANNQAIGVRGDLPWRLSSDLRRFKEITMGHALVMGRKTYDSIGRPLPGRQTIVLTRQTNYRPKGVDVVDSLDAVEGRVDSGRQVMVVGGAQIYEAALPRCATLHVTRVQTEVDADTFFPEFDWAAFELTESQQVDAGPKDDWASEYQIWRRVE